MSHGGEENNVTWAWNTVQRSPQLNPKETQSPSLVSTCSQVTTTYTNLYFCDVNIEEVCEALLSCLRPP
jgi:hypothetical protein